MLYSSKGKLLFCLMQKFVAKKYLFQANGSAKSSSQLVKLDLYKRNHQNSLRLIEIETKAKVVFSGNLVRDGKQDLFQKECQQNLPLDVTFLNILSFYIQKTVFTFRKTKPPRIK